MKQAFTETSFEVVLTNGWKMVWGAVGGLAAVVGWVMFFVQFARPLRPINNYTPEIMALLVSVGGIWYCFHCLTKKVSAVPTRIVVASDGLLIRNKLTNTRKEVFFRNIRAYRHSNY